jgi:lactate dehydrogenase-like 2-hydroxyacid dehydrogenase
MTKEQPPSVLDHEAPRNMVHKRCLRLNQPKMIAMPDTILLATKVPARFLATLKQRFEVLGPIDTPFHESARTLPATDLARIRAILSIGSVNIPPETLALFPGLGLISCLGTGFEGVPLAAARARGIAVTHSPNANASAVADLAMGLLISAVRNLDVARDWLQAGNFKGNAGVRLPSVKGLTGRRVGIYGMGAIGLKIAQRAAAFEMEIAYHNRKPRTDVAYPWQPTLAALAEWADVLMIAVRADASNRQAVNPDIMAALGPDGFVINISRGSVIDEAALAEAIRQGTIRGAGLDVFEHEPAVTPALFDLPHVALTPHIAGNTHDAQSAMHVLVLSNLEAFFTGRPVPTPVPA